MHMSSSIKNALFNSLNGKLLLKVLIGLTKFDSCATDKLRDKHE